MTLEKAALKAAQKYNSNQSGTSWEPDALPAAWQKFKPDSKKFAQLTAEFQQQQGLTVDGMLGVKSLNRMSVIYSTTTDIQGPPAPLDGWNGPLSIVDSYIWDLKGDPDLSPDRIRGIEDLVGCVAHQTGYGPGVERADQKFGDDSLRVDESYAKRMATTLEYKGTVLIGRTGIIVQFAPLKYRTHHSTSAFQAQYARSDWVSLKSVTKSGQKVKVNVSEWPKRWPDLKSPLELPAFAKLHGGGGRSINNHTWSFDLLSPKPGDTYTDAQYISAAKLIHHIHTAYSLPIDRYHVLGHSDINPLDRSNPSGLWDPGPEWDWDRVFNLIDGLG